ncbi:Holliday junction resolvase RuvX [Candidatus Microgenomates bacterium]|nr:Holliday junction resolvase RuvX [Candidatus Microgenomates bacterium]
MKLLGIDYGEKRIGLAISDDLGLLAHERAVLDGLDNDKIIEYLRKMIEEEGIDMIVLGLPINTAGEETEKTQEVRDFASMLENCLGCEVAFEDERFTTVQVDRILKEMDISQKRARGIKDMIAAKIILQGYMDRIKKE